ncbi:MAG TPA: hypothetical protein VKA06_09650, partial [Spirochaetia bacterium]|nr:hypothetical protein [Spirochaetia bacterium]
MYTLAVEIHGLRQLERLQSDLIADIRRRAVSVMEVQGAKFSVQQGGLWLFRFERAQPDDREGVLEALSQTTSLLAGRENELAGWGVYLDFIEGAAADAARVVREALHRVYEDNAVWLGQTAYTLLGAFVDAEAAGSAGTLYRLNGRLGAGSDEVGSVLEFARIEASVEAILDGLVPDDLVGGMLMVVGDDPLALRVNVRAALERFVGTSPAVRWLEAEPDGHDDYGPLLSTFAALDVHETPFWLDEAARASWEERVPLVAAELARDVSSILPDSYDVDLLIAFEGYLAAFVRRAAASVIPPVLVCHDIDRWPALALEALARTVGRMPVPDGEPALMLVATASRAPGSASIAPLVRTTIRLPRPSLADLRAAGVGDVNSERLMRLTHGHAAATIHYLAESRYWDGVTDAALEGVTESDIAWRVAAGLDSDVQEVLLAAHYGAPFVSRDQFVDICVTLGADRVRVPAVLSRLRLLGLIVDRERVVPAHPDHKARLEAALGRAATTLYERVAGAVIELVDAGRVEATERLLDTVSRLSEGAHLPRLYHALLTRVMSRRRIEEAQRLLFDAVPPRGFHPRSRGCMQAVVSANRLRLALLQGNMQAAERTKSSSDRISDGERCDFAAGDLAVQKARLSFQNGPTKETVALLKRAIMIYQDLDDQAGLARANLDFGLVLLGQEDILGAREYFLLAGKSAAGDDDSFEQIRARVYTLVCEYVYGNLTRTLAQADDLDGRARAAGMREIQLFAELARGRALFELGRYEEAGDVFSRGRSRARLY